jgi:hypothetical protein
MNCFVAFDSQSVQFRLDNFGNDVPEGLVVQKVDQIRTWRLGKSKVMM